MVKLCGVAAVVVAVLLAAVPAAQADPVRDPVCHVMYDLGMNISCDHGTSGKPPAQR